VKKLAPLLFLFPFCAGAAALTESFTSRATLASGTAIWNQALGQVHPGLQVVDYEAGWTAIPVDLGDGSDGAFEISTYANFSRGGDISGNKIRIDTDDHKLLQFTSFRLEQGWTIEPVGSRPLVIYALGDVVILGTIDCSGADGGNGGATPGAGAIGRCGGGSGGDGGALGQNGADGESPDGAIAAGGGCTFNSGVNTPGMSGGGGGGWSTNPTAGALGVNAGTSFNDPEFDDALWGGAGGGGGAASNMGIGFAGAGGGAGGGAVIIHAGRDVNLGEAGSNYGSINVNGGIGGGTGNQAGAGGGGAGGSVLIFAGRTINVYNNHASGASRALSGLGGTNSLGNNGGNGGMGRSWFASRNYNGVGFYTPAERSPVNDPGYLGVVRYVSSPQYVISRPVDLESNFAQVLSLSATPASPDFKLEVAGSSDGFAADDTGFTENVNAVSGKRYLRFRLTLTGGNDAADEAVINLLVGERDEFNLQSAGCGRVAAPHGLCGGTMIAFVFLFLGLLKFQAQRQKAVRAKGIVGSAQ
jgi:hypothetical protein